MYNMVFSQTFTMSNSNVSTCSGKFYDSGGIAGNYGYSEDKTMVFTSNNGNRISFIFKTFITEYSNDYLEIYDGASILAPFIGRYRGSASPDSGNCPLRLLKHIHG